MVRKTDEGLSQGAVGPPKGGAPCDRALAASAGALATGPRQAQSTVKATGMATNVGCGRIG